MNTDYRIEMVFYGLVAVGVVTGAFYLGALHGMMRIQKEHFARYNKAYQQEVEPAFCQVVEEPVDKNREDVQWLDNLYKKS